MIDATNPALHKTPESFQRVRVDVADHVDFGAVFDSAMLVPIRHVTDAIVRRKLIGKDRGLWKNVLMHHVEQRGTFEIIYCHCPNSSFAFHDTYNRSLFLVTAHRS